MHNFSLSSEQDLANFLKNKKFEKIFILCGKKSYVASGAKKILSKYLISKSTHIISITGASASPSASITVISGLASEPNI